MYNPDTTTWPKYPDKWGAKISGISYNVCIILNVHFTRRKVTGWQQQREDLVPFCLLPTKLISLPIHLLLHTHAVCVHTTHTVCAYCAVRNRSSIKERTRCLPGSSRLPGSSLKERWPRKTSTQFPSFTRRRLRVKATASSVPGMQKFVEYFQSTWMYMYIMLITES